MHSTNSMCPISILFPLAGLYLVILQVMPSYPWKGILGPFDGSYTSDSMFHSCGVMSIISSSDCQTLLYWTRFLVLFQYLILELYVLGHWIQFSSFASCFHPLSPKLSQSWIKSITYLYCLNDTIWCTSSQTMSRLYYCLVHFV